MSCLLPLQGNESCSCAAFIGPANADVSSSARRAQSEACEMLLKLAKGVGEIRLMKRKPALRPPGAADVETT